MTFAEAIPFLLEGKFISSKSAGGQELHLADDPDIEDSSLVYFNGYGDEDYPVSSRDFIAEDWEVVE